MPTKTKKNIGNSRVRIRMYRQGLGDCFLLSFPTGGGKPVHVMIDCGVVLGTSKPETVMRRVAEDIKKETGGTVDVLVITHEHWDHLSGFDAGQARQIFDTIQFDALWLAWTEEEGNVLADQLREERAQKKKAALAAKAAAEKRGLKKRAERMAELLGLFGASAAASAGDTDEAEEGGGTAGALAFLKAKCEPTILETGGKPRSIPGVQGVRVYVLGPPMDRDAIKKTNPYKGEGYGLGGTALADAFLAAFDSRDECGQPFSQSARLPMHKLKARLRAALAEEAKAKKAQAKAGANGRAVPKLPPRAGLNWYTVPEKEWRSIEDVWLGAGERLALQLDNATNNTSLVLAFEFEESNDVLLFVGDAQAGNWRSWDKYEWMVKDRDGEERKVTATDLLQRTIFYKVGHHGSHNATLQEKGLERMSSRRLAAVIPVDTLVAHKVKGWEHMPLPAIQERLKDKCAVIFQSDASPVKRRGVPDTDWAHSKEKFDVHMKNKKTRKVEAVRKQPLYTDYFI